MSEKKTIQQTWSSPRWSGEITDCALPMTMDTYSKCSYGCVYCFATNQKAIGRNRAHYVQGKPRGMNVYKVRGILSGERESQFTPFVRRRHVVQWGSMSDPLDEYERQYGLTLELLRHIRELEYPVTLSTKGAWWTEDPRYVEVFNDAKHLHVKVSIITLDEIAARKIERGCPSPRERLDALERIANFGCGGVTLRLRPFIPGLSEHSAAELIRQAADRGAMSVSTEFYCMEQRSPAYYSSSKVISDIVGCDIRQWYRKCSPGAGYLRLNREVKRPHIFAMKEVCDQCRIPFYVSDAHFKELCPNGCCCGLPETWNYTRGQLCEGLVRARRNGRITWSELSEEMGDSLDFRFADSQGFNIRSSEYRAKFHNFTMREYLQWLWNNVNGGKSPYKYTGGILVPDCIDENGDVVYRYAGE